MFTLSFFQELSIYLKKIKYKTGGLFATLQEVKKLPIARRSEILTYFLQWWSMRKYLKA